MENENKMATEPISKLYWKLGLPMIISMVLQALYNVIDSVFITNMKVDGNIANEALTLAFPIQILMIAIGVGTGIGINALLSKNLGEKNDKKVSQIVGNGIFISLIVYLFFLLFGIFFSQPFIRLFTSDIKTIEMGSSYLSICCIFSLGSIGYTVYERFLQATGKSLYSTIAQISGAVTNIVLDYVFIFPCAMGVKGAAYATVIGQFLSLFIAMRFHYFTNKEIDKNLHYIKPSFSIIREIYHIGLSAIGMQALLSIMMAGMNVILGHANADSTILVGAFGIYYKIQQIALFSAFGLSNTIITILSFNLGLNNLKRIKECIHYGMIDTVLFNLFLSILFFAFAYPISSLFALSSTDTKELVSTCALATKIGSVGFVFMGFTIAVQGMLQASNKALKPFILSLLRLVIFVFPIAYLFTLSSNVTKIVWWSLPISEILTAIVAFIFYYHEKKKLLHNEKK